MANIHPEHEWVITSYDLPHNFSLTVKEDYKDEREKERERERGSGRGGRRRGRREVTERAGTAHRGAGKMPPAKDIAGQTEGCNRVGDREESRMCGEQELEPQGGKADMSARRGRALA